MAFPRSEYRDRVDTVQREMQQRDIDALVITNPKNYYYLTGYRTMGQGLAPIVCAVVPVNADPRMLVRKLEERALEEFAWTSGEVVADDEDPFEYLYDMLDDADANEGTVGLEMSSKFMTARGYLNLQEAFPEAEFEDITGMMDPHRQVKSDLELEYIRDASEIADAGLRAAADAVEPGVTQGEVIAAAQIVMNGMGHDDMSQGSCFVWGGPNGGIMHDTRLDHEFEDGDVVTIEVFGIQELYSTNAMSTIYVGDDPPDELQERYDATWALHDAGQQALQPGNTMADSHIAVDEESRSQGMGEYYRRVGGTIGINFQPTVFFEGASLVKGQDRELDPGMTILVQPGPLEPEMIVTGSTSIVTEDGPEQITSPLESLTY